MANPEERSQAITLMARNAEFFGGTSESVEQDLIALAKKGDVAAIDAIFEFYAGNEDKIIEMGGRELKSPEINEIFKARIQRELGSVFQDTLKQIEEGIPTELARLKLAFAIPYCPAVDLFIEKSDRRSLKRALQSLPASNISTACAGYKSALLPAAIEKIRQVDYRSAMDLLKSACGAGSAKACVEMAELYSQNKAPGVDVLSDKARTGLYVEILERAIALDEIEAYLLLGGLLVEAPGGEREKRGRKLLEEAYSRGSIDALYLLVADELKGCFFCSAKTCQRLASYITRAGSTALYLDDAKELYRKKRCD